jgi:hypothetical protein
MTIRCIITSTREAELAAKNGKSSRQFLLDSLALASRGEVELVSDPSIAEVILFAEWHGDEPQSDDVQRVLSTDLYKQYRTKTIIHSGKDDPRPLIPGLYPSLSDRLCRVLACQGAPYLQPTNPFVGTASKWDGEVNHLASFVGAAVGKPVRLELLKQAAIAGWRDILVRDTHSEYVGTLVRGDEFGHNALKRQFAVDLLRAKFALCPAGAGLSSFRIYEAMQAGRAPVVIADGWSAPPGPDWDSFLIRVPQHEIQHLPSLLRERESEWETLGARALKAWKLFYSPENFGVTIVRQACEVLSAVRSRRTSVKIVSNAYVYGVRSSRRLGAFATFKIKRALKTFPTKKPNLSSR